mgnify:CR=1 FL=1
MAATLAPLCPSIMRRIREADQGREPTRPVDMGPHVRTEGWHLHTQVPIGIGL